MEENNVFIIGAGPVGLTMAIALRIYNVPITIIDSRSGPTKDSKGLLLNIPSLYGFKLLGIKSYNIEKGARINSFSLYWDNHRYSRIDFLRLDFPINHLHTQPQWKTEHALLDELQSKGVEVKWGHTLTNLEKHEQQYRMSISVDNNTIQNNTSYLIGCDGKRSFIRKQIGCGFNGVNYPLMMSLSDCQMQLDLNPNEIHYFIYEDDFFILVPLSSDQWRVVTQLRNHSNGVGKHRDRELLLQRYFGEDFQLPEPKWYSDAQLYMRVADKISHERQLFIAGDAAHLFSPIGGTGMNTGIQDALNLAWKISFVYHGFSEPSLLDRYEQERLPAIIQAAETADLSTRLITRTETSHSHLDILSPKLCNRHHLKNDLPIMYSALGVKNGSSTSFSISKLFATLLSQLSSKTIKELSNRIVLIVNIDLLNQDPGGIMRILDLKSNTVEYPQLFWLFYKSTNTPVIKINSQTIYDLDTSKLPISNTAIEVVQPDGFCFHQFKSNEIYKIFDKIISYYFLLPQLTSNT